MLRARSLLLVACAVGVTSVIAASVPASARPTTPPGLAKVRCFDHSTDAMPLSLTVEGQQATGQYTLPDGAPKALVVYAHGYGHTSDSWVEHMQVTSAEHDAIAVAMDYRGLRISPDSNGDGLRESTGWPVMEGAKDMIAATHFFDDACPSIETIVMFGVSMGGNSSGLAVALAKDETRSDGKPLYDYWVDVEGATNVIETYNEARALAPANAFAKQAQADIEEEMGGTFESNQQAYVDHCVVCRIDDVAASGIKGAVVIQGVDDGLVPYNQSREMVAALAQAQVPVDGYTVGRKSPESERETTATGYAGSQVDPNYRSPFAGHASEKSDTHIIMVTAFDKLWDLLGGSQPGPYREFMVDGEAGTFPLLP
ncbi:MAG TPA: alpha/beta fold hydrolase [Actinomycetota bacterium]|nr:alpha/beta fold hydrolase [Actinomycetota bacterium]